MYKAIDNVNQFLKEKMNLNKYYIFLKTYCLISNRYYWLFSKSYQTDTFQLSDSVKRLKSVTPPGISLPFPSCFLCPNFRCIRQLRTKWKVEAGEGAGTRTCHRGISHCHSWRAYPIDSIRRKTSFQLK